VLCSKDVVRVVVRFAVRLGFVFLAVSPEVWAQTAPTPVNLSSSVGGGSNPVMLLDASGGIDVAWLGTGVFFARSTDGGATFTTRTVLPLTAPPPGLQMAIDAAGNIELLWPTDPDNTHPGGSAFFSRSTDGGMTFSTATQFQPAGGITSSAIQLVVEPGGAIDIVWLDQLRTNLFFSRSADGGAHFSAPVKVWPVSGDLADLHVKAGGVGQVYIFWTHIVSSTQCDLLFSRTLDGGTTFSTIANISNTTGACSASPSPLLDPNGGINVSWLVNNQSVWFTRSVDQGAHFSAPTNASGGAQFFVVSNQQIGATGEGDVDVVWTGELAENTVFLAHSNDQGATFSAPKIISLPPKPNNTGAGNDVIGEDSCGDLFVAWSDDSVGAVSGDFDAFLARSTDHGFTFTNALDLSNTPSNEEVVSQIAVDAQGNSNILWTTAAFPSNVLFTRVAESALRPGDFETAVFPRSLTAAQGASEQFAVAAVTFRSTSQTVNFSCSDLPSSATCAFNPPSVTTDGFIAPSAMTLTIPATLAPGAYLFGVNGVSTSTTSTQTVELTVVTPAMTGSARPRAAAATRQSPAAAAAPFNHQNLLPQMICASANEQLCSVLHPGSRQWPRARHCRVPLPATPQISATDGLAHRESVRDLPPK
jgi:hypothetical protein